MVWPHGFRQELLPIPEYQEGDRVQFVLDESCARDGTVRLVLFQGDISRMQAERGEAIKRSNLGADDITYLSPHVVMIIRLKPLISLGALSLSNEFRMSCLYKNSWCRVSFHDAR
jgi:hypothetical protein